MKSPTDIYHARCAALGASPARPITLAEMQADADPLDADGPNSTGQSDSGDDCTAQVGDLVRSIVVDPNLDVSAKRAKINKALALLDEPKADNKPSDDSKADSAADMAKGDE